MASIKYDPIVGGVVPVEPGGIQQPEQTVPVSPVDKMKELLRNVKSQRQAPPQQPVSEPIQYTTKSMEPPLALSMANRIPFVNLFTDPILDRYTQKKMAKEQQYQAIFKWADTINTPEEAKKFARIPAVQAAFISKLPGVEDAQDIEDLLTMKLDPYSGDVKIADIVSSIGQGVQWSTKPSEGAVALPHRGKSLYATPKGAAGGKSFLDIVGPDRWNASGLPPYLKHLPYNEKTAVQAIKNMGDNKLKYRAYTDNGVLWVVGEDGAPKMYNVPPAFKTNKVKAVDVLEATQDGVDPVTGKQWRKGDAVMHTTYEDGSTSLEVQPGVKKSKSDNIFTFLSDAGIATPKPPPQEGSTNTTVTAPSSLSPAMQHLINSLPDVD